MCWVSRLQCVSEPHPRKMVWFLFSRALMFADTSAFHYDTSMR
jgi:hypothetical protein